MLFNIAIFLLVLGLLIFFHEMGHFLAAKACGVYVDRFSLGMPPRVWGFRWGDTDYCIGALPIGGYVKMAGQEDAPRSEEEQMEDYSHVPPDQWFNKKPVWQRYIIILAGPAMNVVLAVLLFGLVAAVGADVPLTKIDNRIGSVEPDSPAASAPLYPLNEDDPSVVTGEPVATGWQTGDRVVSVNGEPIVNMFDVAIGAVLGGQEMARVVIEREDENGNVTRFISPVRPAVLDDTGYPRFGIGPFNTALIASVQEGNPADAAGLEAGDIIVRADGRPVDTITFTRLVEQLPPGTELVLDVERDNELIKLPVHTERVGRFREIGFAPPLNLYSYVDQNQPVAVSAAATDLLRQFGVAAGTPIARINDGPATWGVVRDLMNLDSDVSVSIEADDGTRIQGTAREIIRLISGYDGSATPSIAMISDDLEEATGLKRRDVLLEINGEPATIERLRRIEQEAAGEVITLTVQRPPVLFGLLRRSSVETSEIEVGSVSAIGVIFGQKRVFHRAEPSEVVPQAFQLTAQASTRIFRTIRGLVVGDLSVKELGGPVMIYEVTTTSARMGYSWLLEITAFISVNLAIFNLLPLPVLDGGQCVLLAIEGIRRKPLDIRIIEKIQQFGLLLIIFLMLFVTANDIQRLFQNMLS